MKMKSLTYKERLMEKEYGMQFTDWDIYEAMVHDKIKWNERIQIYDEPAKPKQSAPKKPVKEESKSDYNLLMLG